MKTTKIRQSARGETCTFNLPGICSYDTETVVLCHAPHPDKGMGYKGPDTWAAYGCADCHAEMDGRTSRFFVETEYPFPTIKMQRAFAWYASICETQRRLIKKGLMPS